MAIVPVTLCARNSAAVAAQTCTCGHGDGHACPMHHPASSSRSKSCSCQSSSDPAAAIAASLFGPSATLAPSVDSIQLALTSDRSRQTTPHLLDASSIPDAPPPRL
jgi:hypothetical protein